MLMVPTDSGIDKIPMAEHHHEGEEEEHAESGEAGQAEKEHHEHEGPAPHVWLDPALVAIQAEAMAHGLASVDPGREEEYQAYLTDFKAELSSLDQEIKNMLASVPAGNRKFLVFHPSWGYFAKRYGLEQIAMEVEGKEPSLKEMEEIVKHAREDKIKVVFVQPQFSSKSAEVLAREIGAKIVRLDPLAENWAENLRQAARSFTEALQ